MYAQKTKNFEKFLPFCTCFWPKIKIFEKSYFRAFLSKIFSQNVFFTPDNPLAPKTTFTKSDQKKIFSGGQFRAEKIFLGFWPKIDPTASGVHFFELKCQNIKNRPKIRVYGGFIG